MESLSVAAKTQHPRLYQNLEKREIRLVSLRRSYYFFDEIHLQMFRTDFADQPLYKALSYVWGSPEVTSTIFVNGLEFQATTNLVSALRHIRQTQDHGNLWIDAICIDQQDTNERSHQVQLMSTIYERAQEVIAWLGEEKDDSDEAMELLERWGSALDRVGVDRLDRVFSKWNWFQTDNNAEEFVEKIWEPFPRKAFNALSALHDRPYWRRLWIFQEFVLARKVSIMCGRQLLDAKYLVVVVFFAFWEEYFPMSKRVSQDDFDMVRESFLSLIDSRWLIYELLKWRYRIHTRGKVKLTSDNENEDTLFHLLWNCSSSECSDRRDHLFAVSGFCESESDSFPVDYSLSEDQTFIEFARSCILRKNFRVLCYAGIGYKDQEEPSFSHLPSWVPSWGGPNTRPTIPLPLVYSYYSAGKHLDTETPHFDAQIPRQLNMTGFICDTIVEVLEGWSQWEDSEDTRWKYLLFKEGRGHKYVNGIPLLQAYFRTLAADSHPNYTGRLKQVHAMEEANGETSRPLYGGFVVNFLERYCIESEKSISIIEKRNLLTELIEQKDVLSLGMGSFFDDGEKPSSKRWAEWIRNAAMHKNEFLNLQRSEGRSFFTTKKGYMGTGPPFAKKGDVVCLAEGANVPFLLQRDLMSFIHRYHLVGEAFILGLMDGESRGPYDNVTLC